MSTSERRRLTPLPSIRRLGFDDGWASFGPTFLNFGCPSIFVDRCFLPDAERLGFEPFATRPTGTPLPRVAMYARVLGATVSLYLGSQGVLVASHQYVPAHPSGFEMTGQLVVLVGDSWEVSLGWSALWTCHIGRATVSRGSGLRPFTRGTQPPVSLST